MISEESQWQAHYLDRVNIAEEEVNRLARFSVCINVLFTIVLFIYIILQDRVAPYSFYAVIVIVLMALLLNFYFLATVRRAQKIAIYRRDLAIRTESKLDFESLIHREWRELAEMNLRPYPFDVAIHLTRISTVLGVFHAMHLTLFGIICIQHWYNVTPAATG